MGTSQDMQRLLARLSTAPCSAAQPAEATLAYKASAPSTAMVLCMVATDIVAGAAAGSTQRGPFAAVRAPLAAQTRDLC